MKPKDASAARVTIRTVAAAAGVTIATASRSFNDAYGVHPRTRAHVLQVASELNYSPNRFAQGLVTGKSYMIGLIVSDVRNSYFAEVARGVEDAAFSAGRDVMLCNSDLSASRQLHYISSLLEKRAEGIIMNSVANLSHKEQVQIASANVPIVLLNSATRGSRFSNVTADNEAGGKLAASYLLRCGHRKVVHLTGPKQHANLALRARGFVKQMKTQPGTEVQVVHATHTLQGGFDAARTLFEAPSRATAIFAANDAMAIGVLKAALDARVDIPSDISLIGFDDVELAGVCHPPLTTIHQPKYELGTAAYAMLAGLREAKFGSPRQTVMPVRLVERGSVARRVA